MPQPRKAIEVHIAAVGHESQVLLDGAAVPDAYRIQITSDVNELSTLDISYRMQGAPYTLRGFLVPVYDGPGELPNVIHDQNASHLWAVANADECCVGVYRTQGAAWAAAQAYASPTGPRVYCYPVAPIAVTVRHPAIPADATPYPVFPEQEG